MAVKRLQGTSGAAVCFGLRLPAASIWRLAILTAPRSPFLSLDAGKLPTESPTAQVQRFCRGVAGCVEN